MVYHGSPFLAQRVWTGALRTLLRAGVSKSPRGIHKLLSCWQAKKKFQGEGFCDMCPPVGEVEVSSPIAPVMPHQQPQRPEGQSGLSRGVLTHGKGASAKNS